MVAMSGVIKDAMVLLVMPATNFVSKRPFPDMKRVQFAEYGRSRRDLGYANTTTPQARVR